ncbi:hypothetical protein J2741_002512 [Methanolinea mesophila]|uniref:hypothetical protein n=1 Tax=Methanolinea mesophila TaxID=547055 RepID=UPI001AE37284|nr:hypothetical protein [Methanolinea mesophila]MBP1929916.1 hypothetical protein [Methanolinea mesophila]
MRQSVSVHYTRAGTARRSGRGLAMEIGGASFFITPEELPVLLGDRPAEVVNHLGEKEGTAWLSPLASVRKQDLTALIRENLYVLTIRDLQRIISGSIRRAQVMEFHPPAR